MEADLCDCDDCVAEREADESETELHAHLARKEHDEELATETFIEQQRGL